MFARLGAELFDLRGEASAFSTVWSMNAASCEGDNVFISMLSFSWRNQSLLTLAAAIFRGVFM